MHARASTAIMCGVMALLFIALLLYASVYPAGSEEVHDHSAMGELGRFYAQWKKPDTRNNDGQRVVSCCSERDCTPRPTRVHPTGGQWQYLSLFHGQWMDIPPRLLEQNYADAEESPDGQSHACENPNSGMPYCFTLGSGT